MTRFVRKEKGQLIFDEDLMYDKLDELAQYTVPLIKDPSHLGPTYLQERLSQAREYLTEIEILQADLIVDERRITRTLESVKTEFELEYADKLTNDTDVARLRAAKDREARVKVMLKDLLVEIHRLEQMLGDVQGFAKVVKTRKDNLSGVQRDIRSLRQLLKDALEMGTIFGEETDREDKPSVDPSVLLDGGAVSSEQMQSFDDVFSIGTEDSPDVDAMLSEIEIDSPTVMFPPPESRKRRQSSADYDLDSLLDSL